MTTRCQKLLLYVFIKQVWSLRKKYRNETSIKILSPRSIWIISLHIHYLVHTLDISFSSVIFQWTGATFPEMPDWKWISQSVSLFPSLGWLFQYLSLNINKCFWKKWSICRSRWFFHSMWHYSNTPKGIYSLSNGGKLCLGAAVSI